MPVEMDVGVDPTWHYGERAKIVIGFFGTRPDGDDAGAFNNDLLITQRAAFAIQNCAGLQHDAVLRGSQRSIDEQEKNAHGYAAAERALSASPAIMGYAM